MSSSSPFSRARSFFSGVLPWAERPRPARPDVSGNASRTLRSAATLAAVILGVALALALARAQPAGV
jgi:hypothetical protein